MDERTHGRGDKQTMGPTGEGSHGRAPPTVKRTNG